mmetsp:Transcript_29100/g.66257  ORF Transcript_29100/g.66257 Transcript_29100/m.66257 type:complete len:826 (+) Transcript_29100:147-2624(+)
MPQFRTTTPSSSPASAPVPPPVSSMGERGGCRPSSANNEICIPVNFEKPLPSREIARGVSNLGNTCYMNAALQALAHCPELCNALDTESHVLTCPVAHRNARRRLERGREDVSQDPALESSNSRPLTELNSVGGHRRTNSSSSVENKSSKGSKKKRTKKDDPQAASDPYQEFGPNFEFCTLCEVERLLARVHNRPEPSAVEEPDGCDAGNDSKPITQEDAPVALPADGPVLPEPFVSGFMSSVAPWFRRGVQEDSHEFLRLLIDAMQNSCKGARAGCSTGGSKDKTISDDGGSSTSSSSSSVLDGEYPFRLFRGTVESNVTCAACGATSKKVDPIEDIGLDILPSKPAAPRMSSTRMSSSRSSSPTSINLLSVDEALKRFVSSENLDTAYKCEKCGSLGKATKTSELGSIPPILTLHLKRFRYGSQGSTGLAQGGLSRSGRAARGGGSALIDNDYVGPSGSAKIEGHVKFSNVLLMRAYLTPEFKESLPRSQMCVSRLFAVVVHTGKNSHSGHYVVYVHDVNNKKGWWKMDDSKVYKSSWDEVQNVEAYMLFYRVVGHPVAKELESAANAKTAEAERIMKEIERAQEAAKIAAEGEVKIKVEEAAKATASALHHSLNSFDEKDAPPNGVNNTPHLENELPPLDRKRQRPDFVSGPEWSKACTNLSDDFHPYLNRAQDFIADTVQLTDPFLGIVGEEFERMSSALSVGKRLKNSKKIRTLLGRGPRGVCPAEDVEGGVDALTAGLLDLLYQIRGQHSGMVGGEVPFLKRVPDQVPIVLGADGGNPGGAPPSSGVVEEKKDDDLHHQYGGVDGLVVADNNEGFDGAL